MVSPAGSPQIGSRENVSVYYHRYNQIIKLGTVAGKGRVLAGQFSRTVVESRFLKT